LFAGLAARIISHAPHPKTGLMAARINIEPGRAGTAIPLALCATLALAGCATAPQEVRIERISAEELEARLPQPASPISLAEIVAMSRAGVPATNIVLALDAAHARFRLSATQIVDLRHQGVPLTVLDHMVAGERRATFDDMAAEIMRREQAFSERLARELNLCRLQATPLIWPHPFGDCWPAMHGTPFWHCF
jgi:hypothetical protein